MNMDDYCYPATVQSNELCVLEPQVNIPTEQCEGKAPQPKKSVITQEQRDKYNAKRRVSALTPEKRQKLLMQQRKRSEATKNKHIPERIAYWRKRQQALTDEQREKINARRRVGTLTEEQIESRHIREKLRRDNAKKKMAPLTDEQLEHRRRLGRMRSAKFKERRALCPQRVHVMLPEERAKANARSRAQYRKWTEERREKDRARMRVSEMSQDKRLHQNARRKELRNIARQRGQKLTPEQREHRNARQRERRKTLKLEKQLLLKKTENATQENV